MVTDQGTKYTELKTVFKSIKQEMLICFVSSCCVESIFTILWVMCQIPRIHWIVNLNTINVQRGYHTKHFKLSVRITRGNFWRKWQVCRFCMCLNGTRSRKWTVLSQYHEMLNIWKLHQWKHVSQLKVTRCHRKVTKFDISY